MVRAILLILFVIVFVSCESDVETPPKAKEFILAMDWLPGDSLIGALVSVPDDANLLQGCFRIYDLTGAVRREYRLPHGSYPDHLIISADGRTAFFTSSTIFSAIDIASGITNDIFIGVNIKSVSPDKKYLVLRREEDNPISVPDDRYAIARLENASVIVDTFLTISAYGFGTLRNFPFLLSGRQIVTQEEVNNIPSVVIRDSALRTLKQHSMPTGFLAEHPRASRAGSHFYFLSPGVNGMEVSKFNTLYGFIDQLHEISTDSGFYRIIGDGSKIIYHPEKANVFIKDVDTGELTEIANSNTTILARVSNDELLIALGQDMDEKAVVKVIPVP